MKSLRSAFAICFLVGFVRCSSDFDCLEISSKKSKGTKIEVGPRTSTLEVGPPFDISRGLTICLRAEFSFVDQSVLFYYDVLGLAVWQLRNEPGRGEVQVGIVRLG
jgi:hypothetical protein